MAINPQDVMNIVTGILVTAGGALALASQMPFIKDRPQWANFVAGCQKAAARLALILPPGTTVAQAEAAIAAEAATVLTEYQQSNTKKADLARTQKEIGAALGQILPPGHIAQPPAAPPALQTLNQVPFAPIVQPAVTPAAPILPVAPAVA